MGCGNSSNIEESDRRKNAKDIDQNMANQARKEAEKIKLLLLGAGESGKSTIFKQMKVIYGDQYSDAERKQQLPTIYSNVLQAIKVLAEQAVVFNLVGQIKCKEKFDMIRLGLGLGLESESIPKSLLGRPIS
jgi:GTPase SAR1 family protein